MNEYTLYIKSYTDAPDWEQELEASNPDEAVEKFYVMLKGEYDKQWIYTHLEEQSGCCSWSVDDFGRCNKCKEGTR